MKIVIINGYARSGKDTFVQMVEEELVNHLVLNVSSVDEIKEIAIEYFGWDGVEKSTKTRQLLSDLKILQTSYCDGPFNYMVRRINEFREVTTILEKAAIFLHIREVDEIRKMKSHYPDAITVLMYRPDFEQDVISDIYNYPYDVTISNNGNLNDLRLKAKLFIENNELGRK